MATAYDDVAVEPIQQKVDPIDQKITMTSIRLVYVIAASFALLASVICWALSDDKSSMNYRTE